MKATYQIPAAILLSIIFTILFYHESVGINLLIFEFSIFAYLIFIERIRLSSRYILLSFFATFISAIAFVINFTAFALLFNLTSFFVFSGVLIYPQTRSLLSSVNLAFKNIPDSIRYFIEAISFKSESRGIRIRKINSSLKLSIVPLLLIILFLGFYNISTPYFNDFFDLIFKELGRLFNGFNFELISLFLTGLFVSLYIIFRRPDYAVIKSDSESKLNMFRQRVKSKFTGMMALKKEFLAAVLLLIILNAILLFVNVLNIWNVWINFSWNGSYLKQFVHEGTYVLIFSILTSIGIVLYYFKGNMNFYSRSNALKFLSVLWMIQNGFLALSVGLRNFWYIQYFALAYKRIGVFLFLILTLYGIYTVIIKIREKKSAYFLLRNNLAALYLMLFVFSLFNWDSLIARYNFSHYRKSFVHFDFLASMPDKSLPFLLKTKNELSEIDSAQVKLFQLQPIYMTSEQYYSVIQNRKFVFKERWEQKSYLSWNYAEYNAYKQLELMNTN